jgi:hypothetical protein
MRNPGDNLAWVSRARLISIAVGTVVAIALLATATLTLAIRPSLSATLVLSASTVRAGGEISGQVVVENLTGRDIKLAGCHSIFEVLLRNSSYSPDPGWELCLEQIRIPTGHSSYPAAVHATYAECGQTGATGGIPACLSPPNVMPPLPAGVYWATTYEDGSSIPLPGPIKVTVT